MKTIKKTKKLSRRKFLKKTTTGILGAGVFINTGKYFQTKGEKPSIKDVQVKQRILGRTGIKVSEVGLGTWEAPNENVISYAIERGFNYFDTAPEYKEGEEEKMVGRVVKNIRDKVIIASKILTTHTSTKTETMKMIEDVLKRLQSDYVDIILIYMAGEIIPKFGLTKGIERLKNDNVHEAMNQAKKEGKIRALGVSAHGGDLIRNMNYAIDCGKFDMIMVKYNFMSFPEEGKLLKKAKDNNVGSVTFKLAAGAYDQKIEGYKNSRTPEFRRATIKWVISNKDISTCIVRMPTFQEVDNVLLALSEKMSYKDMEMLDKYSSLVRPYYCRWCDTCSQGCPYGIAIPIIQRYLMYYTNFGHKESAIYKYNELLQEQRADKCNGCNAPCELLCPNKIPIKEVLTEAHKTLNRFI